MKEYVLTTELRDDAEAIRRYRACHEAVWPEVTDSLKRTGLREGRIYLLGRRLVMVLRTDDDYEPAEAARRHRAAGPRVLEWERLMDGFQERPPGAPAVGEGKWAAMEKIWDLQGRPPGSP